MKNNKKRLLRFIDECGTIRMIDFLKFYVGVTSQIKSLKRATHKNIKSFHFDGVVSVPFDCIDMDDVETGNILLVTDCFHHIGAYRNPNRLKKSKVKVIGGVNNDKYKRR